MQYNQKAVIFARHITADRVDDKICPLNNLAKDYCKEYYPGAEVVRYAECYLSTSGNSCVRLTWYACYS